MRIAKLRTSLTGRVLAVAAIAADGIGASVLPVSADVSNQSPSVASIRLESPATLHARGAAITVPILAVCQPGARAFVGVSVSQNAGGSIASGGGSVEIPSCTGGLQDVDVTILGRQRAVPQGRRVRGREPVRLGPSLPHRQGSTGDQDRSRQRRGDY